MDSEIWPTNRNIYRINQKGFRFLSVLLGLKIYTTEHSSFIYVLILFGVNVIMTEKKDRAGGDSSSSSSRHL